MELYEGVLGVAYPGENGEPISKQVDAIFLGFSGLAVNRDPNPDFKNFWHVTHVTTGMAIGAATAKRKDTCMKYAQYLLELVDWTKPTYEELAVQLKKSMKRLQIKSLGNWLVTMAEGE